MKTLCWRCLTNFPYARAVRCINFYGFSFAAQSFWKNIQLNISTIRVSPQIYSNLFILFDLRLIYFMLKKISLLLVQLTSFLSVLNCKFVQMLFFCTIFFSAFSIGQFHANNAFPINDFCWTKCIDVLDCLLASIENVFTKKTIFEF